MRRRFRSKVPLLILAVIAVAVLFRLLMPVLWPEKGPLRLRHNVAPRTGSEGTPSPTPARQEEIAILIDDIGYDLSAVRKLLAVDAPLSFAVLPYCSHSVAAAREIHEHGRIVLLHLPMEPLDYPGVKPGPGALYTAMNADQITSQVDADLEQVPYAVGINNHMGSRFMEDEDKLVPLFRELKEKNLFFVDSRTTPNSQGRTAAHDTGLRFASRQIFIDNDQNYDATYAILVGLSQRRSGGREPILLIGHPHPSTVAAVRDAMPFLKAHGIKIVPVSALVQRPALSVAAKEVHPKGVDER
ncbi:MAG: divergent polysaccharide deacetylase family protein [Smithellaceae bacterium]|nr:divergent polysaccharide deacetylase family protein [Smithellaceae bacterium]